MKERVSKAFQTIPSEVREWRLSISEMSFEALGIDDSRSLEVPISKKVFFALFNLLEDKASG